VRYNIFHQRKVADIEVVQTEEARLGTAATNLLSRPTRRAASPDAVNARTVAERRSAYTLPPYAAFQFMKAQITGMRTSATTL